MAEENKNEKRFEEINSLYAEYASLRGKENVESKRLSVREKIQIALYRLYVKSPDAAGACADCESYADEILAVTKRCLETFAEGGRESGSEPFSMYACSSIKRRLSFLREKEALELRNGGMKISDDLFKKAHKVRQLDVQYEKFGVKDESARDAKIAVALEIPEEKVRELKAFLERRTLSQIQTDADGGEYDVIDAAAGDFERERFLGPAKLYELNEWLSSLFSALGEELEIKTEKETGEIASFKTLLTVDLLRKHFPHRLADKKDGKDGQYHGERKNISGESAYTLGLEKPFRDAGFFDSGIMERLFADESYRLPEMQSLAEKAGLSKSGVTKMLLRFYEKVIDRYEKAGYERAFAESFLKA